MDFANQSLDLTPKEIADKLKEQWRPYHFGRCYIFSKGDDCGCHLCLIDELLAMATTNRSSGQATELNVKDLPVI